ncbi:unnamed protein product [Thlaspi arvense]|uniref:Reverse transcriptase zinc-binding domain-containing protein n=1 Tax=Thlaspi arvense TaxID=13288 RepID=A0AAU9R9C1_THLAR|nr:unnamed protein product [Thlaspi arvense]
MFSIKTGYNLQKRFNQFGDAEFSWFQYIWNLNTSQKIKHHFWRATNGALPIGLNIVWPGIDANSSCSRCGEQETVTHIWLDCPYAKAV